MMGQGAWRAISVEFFISATDNPQGWSITRSATDNSILRRSTTGTPITGRRDAHTHLEVVTDILDGIEDEADKLLADLLAILDGTEID